MVLHKTRDGFNFDDDPNKVIKVDHTTIGKYSAFVVWYVNLKGWKDKDRSIIALIKLEKPKECLGESWNQEIISRVLEDLGLKVLNVRVNKTRRYLCTTVIVKQKIEEPAQLNIKGYVTRLHNMLLKTIREVTKRLEMEASVPCCSEGLEYSEDDYFPEFYGWTEADTLTDWWEEYHGEEL